MINLQVSFHLKKDGRLTYMVDTVSDEIMNSCQSLLTLKSFYCTEKGYRNKDIENFQILEPEEDE
jgi:hypothetical protein